MKITPDNEYPQVLYKAEESLTVYNEKELTAAKKQGWQTTYIHREYPKHVPTGEFYETKNDDGGVTRHAKTKIVGSRDEEEAFIASLPKKTKAA